MKTVGSHSSCRSGENPLPTRGALASALAACFFCEGVKANCDCGALDEPEPETPMTDEIKRRIKANRALVEEERKLHAQKCHKKTWSHISCETMRTQCGGCCSNCPKK